MTTTTTTLVRILRKDLADFGKELLAEGFKVYVFTSDVRRVANGGLESVATTFGFSREVDGREVRASVSYGLSGFQFSMPIKPSREHGSAMFIDGDDIPEFEDLTVANAERYAAPTGTNRLVGTHENYTAVAAEHLYTELTA